MCRQRRRYRERLEFFRSNVEAVVRIQTFWRAKKTKKDYKQLGKDEIIVKYWQELYLRISPKNITIGEFYCWSMHRINKNVGFM